MFTGVPVDLSLLVLVPEGVRGTEVDKPGVLANKRRPKTAPRCRDIAMIFQED